VALVAGNRLGRQEVVSILGPGGMMSAILATLALAAQVLAGQSNPEDEVAEVVARFGEAFRVADAGALDALLGADYVHTNTGGGVVDREQWLAYVSSRRKELDSGALVLSRYENLDLEVRVHAEAAVVTGLNISEGTRSGEPFARRLRFTQVWVRTPAGWKRVAFHDTEVTQ
jgi:hypothetical protein